MDMQSLLFDLLLFPTPLFFPLEKVSSCSKTHAPRRSPRRTVALATKPLALPHSRKLPIVPAVGPLRALPEGRG